MASRRILVVVSGPKIYVTANPLRSDRRIRTKDSIATVRYLYLDFDIDGEARLTLLQTSDTVPTPTAVLSTSLCRYQILCRIDCFTFEQQESTLKLLAIPFGGDPACMDYKVKCELIDVAPIKGSGVHGKAWCHGSVRSDDHVIAPGTAIPFAEVGSSPARDCS